MYTYRVRATEDNTVVVGVYRDEEFLDSKTFGYTDASWWVYLFGSETSQREDKFKLAHEWAKSYIQQLEKYEK